ncbi:4-hydroxy-tetrahydrodipicolinate reductase [Helicobacter muridarum]|uniref:4-hydroxy-tetrahydrodipicolinate reductase n=1 Tax=Helicobacter muridarum TaxID=216 RepID=A0A099TXG6_9HELI|nr:4-hydroxy-tetrahydrodipicolinate reductase [Helicobacter muridarum]TLE00228.1 4-hydroxy-tetrahydrodipicolinate reductase [Helicobacter muridarum]STQ85717.1 dihydrodipicolinate reductase [Helicobacter muridarum]
MLDVGIFGATGRVGKLLINEIILDKKSHLSSVYVRNELQYDIPSNTFITSDMSSFVKTSRVIIDFSSAEATQLLLESILEVHSNNENVPALVIGTTGLSSNQQDLLSKVSKIVPILYSSNMSFGAALLNRIVALLSNKWRDCEIEITEIHHRYKKDAPSGTALSLANSALKERNLDSSHLKFGREGIALRSKDEIGILSLRGGDLVGRHTVGFYGDGECLELTHTATSRLTFAKGALKAAFWIVDKPSDLYSMSDMFEL